MDVTREWEKDLNKITVQLKNGEFSEELEQGVLVITDSCIPFAF